MSLESFYGGRQGASFIIVKQFDGINIPQSSTNIIYKTALLAVTPDKQTYIFDVANNTFIQKNGDNYKDYIWKLTELNGNPVPTQDLDGTYHGTEPLWDIAAEGMVQCFGQGGNSTDIVNYGEYVIIDTPDKRNPENGKVFRRGMNYQYDPISNPLAGAIYIGQIVGPQGEAPELNIDHYMTIIESGIPYETNEYDSVNEDLIQGSYIDVETSERKFNDKIKWVYANIRDEFGNTIGCRLGFQLPTLTLDFVGGAMEPYDAEGRAISNYTDLIVEDTDDPNGYIDGKWVHPFYQKWKVTIPKGIHGIDSVDLEIVHTKTKPKDYMVGYAGTPVYEDSDCTISYMVGGSPLILTTSVDVLKEEEGVQYTPTAALIYDPSTVSCAIKYNDQTLYVKKSDCYMDVLRYKEVSYNDYQEGRITYHYVCTYDNINAVDVTSDGSIVISMSGKEAPQTIEKAIDWIKSVKLDDRGNFDVVFNNDSLDFEGFDPVNKRYHTVLNWVYDIQIDNDGTIRFYYTAAPDTPRIAKLKFIANVKIETVAEGEEFEGTGDQKVHVTFTDDSESVIGNPLNYIIETVISEKSFLYPNAPYSHLLVYYSDPALRQSMQDKWVTYPSQKYPNQIWDEWVDLGNVRGATGGLRILTDYPNTTYLYDENDQAIPPERLTNDREAYGWAVTITPPTAETSTIFCYDYEDKLWYSIGTIDMGAVNPTSVIVKSVPVRDTQKPNKIDVSMLNENGFWLASEVAYCAE